ncbi:MAG: hypothetical protein M3460_15840 [Actinomycetota bacterium]|nr:hypothetical protein [Actinomycetota bacterium]
MGHDPAGSRHQQPQPQAADSADKRSGRSWWWPPWGMGGLGGATTYLVACRTEAHHHPKLCPDRTWAPDTGCCTRLSALIATLPSPEREIIVLRHVVGMPLPEIVATLGVTPAAIRFVEHQALGALPPARTTNGPTLATRVRVVLLPHTPTAGSLTPTHHHAGKREHRHEPQQAPTAASSPRRHHHPPDHREQPVTRRSARDDAGRT